MKYLLIGLAVAFFGAYALEFIKAWIMEIGYQHKKRHHNREEDWIYEI